MIAIRYGYVLSIYILFIDSFCIEKYIQMLIKSFEYIQKPIEIQKAQAQTNGCLGSHNNFVTSANLNKHYQDKMTV